jgi:glutathione reductase (NADPH)
MARHVSFGRQVQVQAMADFDYDLFVIGAGSGGVRASRVAASHGARVAVAEEYRVGGTCVIRGCVPKKMLVYGSNFAESLHNAHNYGWTIDGASFDWPKLRDFVNKDVDRLEGLYTQTLDNNRVERFLERAIVTGPNTVRLSGGREVSAKYILVAVGSTPVIPDVPGIEHAVSSNEMFLLPELPRRLAVMGAGYIAIEFAGVFKALGSDVTLFNRSDKLLRGYDEEITGRLLQHAEAQGMNLRLGHALKQVTKQADGSLRIELSEGEPVEADVLLVATGRFPNTGGLGLEAAGIELGQNGAIPVDDHNRTQCPSIYAVGDVTDRVQLTPVAIREGHAFADTVFGGKPTLVDYDCIPSAVFSHPPLAGVGLTETEARERFADVKVYRSDFRPMQNIFADRAERGLYKMVVDGATDRVLGVHLIGPEAPEVLQVAAIAVKAGLTKADFDATVALHPSMAEELVLLK